MGNIIISIIIYVFFFFKLGNTLIRTNSFGGKSFSLLPLITEGFIGPIRTLLYLLISCNLIGAFKFIKFEFFRLSNPFSAYFFVYYINKCLIKEFF